MGDWKTEILHLRYSLRHREPKPRQIVNPGPGSLAHDFSQSQHFFPSLVSKVGLFFPPVLAFLWLGHPLSLTIPACTAMAILPPQHTMTQSQWVWYLKPPTPAMFPTLRVSSMDSHGRLTLSSHLSCPNTYSGSGDAREHFPDHRHKIIPKTTAAPADPATPCRQKCDSHLCKKSEQKFSFKDFLTTKTWEANITSQIPRLR